MPDDHFSRQLQLLDLESRAAAQRVIERARRLTPTEAERSGECLLDLVIADEDAGLGGRHLVTLVKRNCGPLPWTRLDVGSPVVLSPREETRNVRHRGIVCQRGSLDLRVALADIPEDLADYDFWRLDMAHDEVAVQRQRWALERAQSARGERLAELREVLLGTRPPRFDRERDDAPLEIGLNEPQRSAVRFALSARDVALVHGPPGTGKTTALIEIIRRAVRAGEKVLACAPSNLAVDNLLVRLIAAGERAVRLGHPARVQSDLREHTLDLLVEVHHDVRLARQLAKQGLKLLRQAKQYTRAKPARGAKQEMRQEARALLADARRLEAKAAEHILDTADIVCATTTGLDAAVLGDRTFGLAVIDEACQSTEPGSWIPLQRCQRVILAGDHCQLPPTVVSDEAQRKGFGVSLFERLMNLHGPAASRTLIVQYRMNAAIMEFPSRELYAGQLVADASVRDHRLCDLPGVAPTPLTTDPFEFIDTAGAGLDEQVEPDGESRFNPGEAGIVERCVRDLLESGVESSGIAIVAPYAAHVRHLREQIDVTGLEIDTVDGFQGREKEAVIISLVRSNPRGEIGFLSDVRRMNVALTRARRKLLVVGDSATLACHPFYARWLEYVEQAGRYRTVWEFE